MFSIQTNVNALVAQQNLSVNSAFQSRTIQQLTSGYRINSAGDDAAGLAVANKFRSQVAELTQGVANGNDAVAQLQIMDGGISNISQMLDRLKTLATQSSSSVFTGDRSVLNSEFQSVVGEINRQSQSIGLNTGGTFAKSLDVYLGGGGGANADAIQQNGIVNVDLSKSTVDALSLGLTGMKAIAGSVAANGTDIGTGSANGTTVQDILSARAGNAEAKTGYATFYLSGPGFAGDSKVAVQVSLSAVSDTNTLVTAINNAIASESGGATQPDQALKGAGITATVNTDQYGHQQLAFISSTSAFQVQAGDQMANALMGNFASGGSATGKAVVSSVTGTTMAASTATFSPAGVSVEVSGAGLSAPVKLLLGSGDRTVGAASLDIVNQVNQSVTLQKAGISASVTTGNKIQFTSATGSTFNVSASGDRSNALGLGSFVTASNGATAYSDISAGVSMAQAATGNGIASLGFSLDGGATGGITPASITATGGAGYNGVLGPNGTVNNAAGALGTMTLTLNGSTSPVTVNFALDANAGANETVQQVADFINNQVQQQAGYGSDVKLATVNSDTNTLVLSGPADGAGAISASGAAAAALGLTQTSGATIVAASGAAGNAVAINLAGGNATSAAATGSAAANSHIATGANTLAMSIDGVRVNADFSQDANSAGSVAAFTSGVLGLNGAASTVNVAALQGTAGAITSGTITSATQGQSGVNTTVDLSDFAAAVPSFDSIAALSSDNDTTATGIDLTDYAAQEATYTGHSLGTPTSGHDINLTSLDLAQFAATKATAVGGSLGADGNAAIDLSQFAAKVATTTGTVSLGSGLSDVIDLSAFAAKAATLTGGDLGASDVQAITDLTAGADDQLVINGVSINLNSCDSLSDVATAIGNNTNVPGVSASVSNGRLVVKTTATNSGASLDIVANNASFVLGLTTAGQTEDATAQGSDAVKLAVEIDGKGTKNIDVSNGGAGTLQDLQDAINNYLKGASGYNSNNYQNTASIDSTGHLKLNSYATGETGATWGEVKVVDNAVSRALGLTSDINGTTVRGADAVKLQVSVDGLGTVAVDVSGQTTVGAVAAKINTDVSGTTAYTNATGYGSVASGSTGTIHLTSKDTGSAASITIADNAVAEYLKLTSAAAGAVDNRGTDGMKLHMVIDSETKDVDVSTADSVSDVIAAINGQFAGSPAGLVETAGVTNGSIKITGAGGATGSDPSTGSKIQITDNAVSRLLGLTTTSNVAVAGTDAKTLNIQVDGKKELHINLTDLDGTEVVDDIVSEIENAVSDATNGWGASYDNGAFVEDTAAGVLQLHGLVTGSTLRIEDNEIARALHLTSGAGDTVVAESDKTLNLQIDGNEQVSIDLASALGNSTAATLTDIARIINAQLAGNTAAGYGAEYAHVATANSNGSITLAGVNGGGAITVVNSGLSTALSLTTGTSSASNSGTAPTTLDISIDGGPAQNISFVGLAGGGAPTLSTIAQAINTAFGSQVASANSNGTLTINGVNKGSATGSVEITNNAAGQTLGFTSGPDTSKMVAGEDETLAQVVSFLNSAAQKALGTSTTADIVGLDSSGKVVVSSQTKGANSSVSVLSAGSTGGLAAALALDSYVDSAATGQARTVQDVVNELKQDFNSNATLRAAGLTASVNLATNSLEITSSNGTQFRLDAWGTKTATTDSDLGFGDAGAAFTNAVSTTTSTASVIDAQGASAIGTFANGVNNTASIAFQAMRYGNDDQSITISATNANGVAQTPLTITLQNDDTAQTGASIDAAVSYINTKIQQTNNSTMRAITAVAETGADGSESINFISSLSSFNVAVSTAGAASGDGFNGGAAQTFSSSLNGAGSSIAIDTKAGAQAAITAISAAVSKLGVAQAAIGKGQNQLGYAIGLAQSQITNFSTAESQIRDANVAQQAANLTKAQVLQQASIAAMAQANSAPQAVLALLRG